MECCNKKPKLTGLLLLGLLGMLLIPRGRPSSSEGQTEGLSDQVNTKNSGPTIISACPTFYDLLMEMNLSEDLKIVRAKSSADALVAVQEKRTTQAVIGRTPKPEETFVSCERLENKESQTIAIISTEEKVLTVGELRNIPIYTDLDEEKLVTISTPDKIRPVDNIYDSLGDEIYATTWDNVDYSKANLVHVFEEDGSRFLPTRQAHLCCRGSCSQKDIEKINYLLGN